MNIETSFTIKGEIVELDKKVFGLELYVPSRMVNDDDAFRYVVRNKKVIGTIEVTADCGQNMGYIDKFEFTEFKD